MICITSEFNMKQGAIRLKAVKSLLPGLVPLCCNYNIGLYSMYFVNPK